MEENEHLVCFRWAVALCSTTFFFPVYECLGPEGDPWPLLNALALHRQTYSTKATAKAAFLLSADAKGEGKANCIAFGGGKKGLQSQSNKEKAGDDPRAVSAMQRRQSDLPPSEPSPCVKHA